MYYQKKNNMNKKLFLPALGLAIMASCSNPASNTETQEATPEGQTPDVTAEPENDAPETYEESGLKIYPLSGSPQYADAKLERKSPADDMMSPSGTVAFDFGVTNYELGSQSNGAGENGLANSGKGQHIHLIVDNGPYSAHYEPTFNKDFEDGHHVAIAFLSRSYHESVKNGSAATVFQFTTGKDVDADPIDMNAPMLFYSRPKGEYKGEDTKKVLLDFYIHNAELSPEGYSVVVTVNKETMFEFDKWQPYVIEGLPMGENTINIQLVDAQGNMVNTPMNNVTRTFTLVE